DDEDLAGAHDRDVHRVDRHEKRQRPPLSLTAARLGMEVLQTEAGQARAHDECCGNAPPFHRSSWGCWFTSGRNGASGEPAELGGNFAQADQLVIAEAD